MTHVLPPDPWQKVRTLHDLPADELISTLQKEIRRGNSENAALVTYELVATSPELEAKVWQRLYVIAVEDIGMGEPQAPVLVHSLGEMRLAFSYGMGDRELFAIHAVRYLCGCKKDRSSDEMLNWIKTAVEKEGLRPQIPDYALDMHTRRGAEMGRGFQHFLQEGSRVSPELPGRDTSYREKLLALMEESGE
jgi:replication-associated recombination protein RarA